MADETVTELLEQLSAAGVDAAWTEFLARYASLIKRVICRHELDDERAVECYDYVCGALSDDGFRRLLSFREEGPARFRTWLLAVVSNLAVDWRRKNRGRARPPQCVVRLPDLDRQVYHYIYERRVSRARCLEILEPRFPGLTPVAVSEINARLFTLLTPQQRWHLSAKPQACQALTCNAVPDDDDDPTLQVAADEPGPEALVAETQDRRRLQQALARLPADQRLLLRLRYEQGLTLAEVARLTGQRDPFRANRRILAAIEALAGAMREETPTDDRKSS